MKALIVFREDDDTDNLFVPILCHAIAQQGIDVHCSLRDFWEGNDTYDIIHFQWPEEAVGWNCTDPATVERLKERIAFYKKQGTRFVYTRHNTSPHYGNPVIRQAYEVIEQSSDLVVHMGQYSLKEFEEKHPGSRNVIIPHHIYEDTYEDIPQAEARQKLGIAKDKFVVTAFGKFRNNEEIKMIVGAFCKYKYPNKCLLAPRMLPFSAHPTQRNLLKRMISLAGYYLAPVLLRMKHIVAGAGGELISNDDLPYYISASDVIVVQRKRILNSGNIPLAFLFRKVVIGPDTGNVGELLLKTGNPVFDPDSQESIIRAIATAKVLSEKGKGEENYRFACREMNTGTVAAKYAKAYAGCKDETEQIIN